MSRSLPARDAASASSSALEVEEAAVSTSQTDEVIVPEVTSRHRHSFISSG